MSKIYAFKINNKWIYKFKKLGTNIKNKIIYKTYHNPENFIPLQEVD